jgi:hypothetical protein
MDGGGVRIFCHLEHALADKGLILLPHLMDSAVLRQFGVPRERQLRLAAAPPPKSAMRDLWDALLETDLVLEQESLPPCRPVVV